MSNVIEPVLSFLEAGRVRRCHIMDTHRHYDVAQHSWGMAILLRMLHPNPSLELFWACLAHDLHERYTGDVPWTAQAMSPDLRAGLQIASDYVERQMGVEIDLNPEEEAWLKALDMLEFYLFCDLEFNMGNRTVEKPRMTAYRFLTSNDRAVPDEVRGFVDTYSFTRTDDVI